MKWRLLKGRKAIYHKFDWASRGVFRGFGARRRVHPGFLHEGERCRLKGGKKERTKGRQDEQGKGEGEVFG